MEQTRRNCKQPLNLVAWQPISMEPLLRAFRISFPTSAADNIFKTGGLLATNDSFNSPPGYVSVHCMQRRDQYVAIQLGHRISARASTVFFGLDEGANNRHEKLLSGVKGPATRGRWHSFLVLKQNFTTACNVFRQGDGDTNTPEVKPLRCSRRCTHGGQNTLSECGGIACLTGETTPQSLQRRCLSNKLSYPLHSAVQRCH